MDCTMGFGIHCVIGCLSLWTLFGCSSSSWALHGFQCSWSYAGVSDFVRCFCTIPHVQLFDLLTFFFQCQFEVERSSKHSLSRKGIHFVSNNAISWIRVHSIIVVMSRSLQHSNKWRWPQHQGHQRSEWWGQHKGRIRSVPLSRQKLQRYSFLY